MIGESKHPSLGIQESQLDASDLRHTTSLINIGFGCVKRETTVCHMPLLSTQCFPSVGEVGQHDHHNDSDQNCKRTLDDVQLITDNVSIWKNRDHSWWLP
jgi:hypothetical protein